MLLQSYPQLRTNKRGMIEAELNRHGYGSRIDLPSGRSAGEFAVHAARFDDVMLTFIRYDSAIRIDVNPTDKILIAFQLCEVSEVAVGGDVFKNSARGAGCLIPDQACWSVRNPSGYQVLICTLPA